MRLTHVLLGGLLANTACSDGVGTPIREALETDAPDSAPGGGRDGGIDIAALTCDDVAVVHPDIAASEDELLQMINAFRTAVVDCGGRRHEPRRQLVFSPELRCSARLHSLDLAVNGEEHGAERTVGSDGSTPEARMAAAGFQAFDSDELIADDEGSARAAFEDLFRRDNNPDPCQRFRDPDHTHIGVGRYANQWTVDFAQKDETAGQQTP